MLTENIEIYEETDYATRFTYRDDSTGLPINLTGYRADLQVRKDFDGYSNPEVALKYTSDAGGGITLGGVNGTVDILIPYTDTKNQTWYKGTWVLVLIDPNGRRERYMSGFFVISANTTKIYDSTLAAQTPTQSPPNNSGAGGVST